MGCIFSSWEKSNAQVASGWSCGPEAAWDKTSPAHIQVAGRVSQAVYFDGKYGTCRVGSVLFYRFVAFFG